MVVSCHRAPPPKVDLLGCEEWPQDTGCAVGHEPLRLWVQGAFPKDLVVSIDGTPIEPENPQRIQQGLRFKLKARAGTLKIVVSGHQPWIKHLSSHTTSAVLQRASRLRDDGARDEADRLLIRHSRTSTAPEIRRWLARSALRKNQVERARTLFEEAIDAAEKAGKYRALLNDRAALAYLLFTRGFPAEEAWAQLNALTPLAARHTEAALTIDYFKLIAAWDARTPGPGLEVSERLLRQAERLDDTSTILETHEARADLFMLIGRWHDVATSLHAVRALLPKEPEPCRQAELLTNIGWYELRGNRQAPDIFPHLPLETLLKAVYIYQKSCPQPREHANALTKLAWAHLFSGQLDAAQESLGNAQDLALHHDAEQAVMFEQLNAEIDLARGHYAQALAGFERTQKRAAEVALLPIEWRSEVGRGEALEGLNRIDDAIAAYRRAEKALDILADRIPIGEGRDLFLFERRQGTQKLIQALTRTHQAKEAIASIRRARLGALRWAEQSAKLASQKLAPNHAKKQHKLRRTREALVQARTNAWMLPKDALDIEKQKFETQALQAQRALAAMLTSPKQVPDIQEISPGPREAFVYAYPIDKSILIWLQTPEGYWTQTSTRTKLLGFDNLSAALSETRRVRIYAAPALEDIDWASWPIYGQPMDERGVTVELAADLPLLPPVINELEATVLADLSGAKPHAQEEGRAIAQYLQSLGWKIHMQIGPASHAETAQLMSRPSALLHYSGHGVQKGLDGLKSGLPVQDNLHFTVEDVLSLPRVPRRIVLAACDLGRRGSRRGAPGFGLVHALLVAGAQEVIATVEPVDDPTATAWISAFYSASANGVSWSEALRRARVKLKQTYPRSDADAFRLWTRRTIID